MNGNQRMHTNQTRRPFILVSEDGYHVEAWTTRKVLWYGFLPERYLDIPFCGMTNLEKDQTGSLWGIYPPIRRCH